MIPGRARLLDGLLEDARLLRELAADVDVGEVDVERVAGDGDPLDQHVGIVLDDVAVLERAGLGLVGVHREVTRADVLRQEGPLEAGGEAGAAAAAEVRLLHLVDDGGRLHAERLVERGVAAVGPVGLERGGVRLPPALRQDERLAHLRPPTISSTFFEVEPLVHLLVDEHRRGGAARAEALDLAQRDAPVARGAAVRDAELLLQVLEDPLAAGEAAGDVRADLDDVPAERLACGTSRRRSRPPPRAPARCRADRRRAAARRERRSRRSPARAGGPGSIAAAFRSGGYRFRIAGELPVEVLDLVAGQFFDRTDRALDSS